MRIRNKYSFWAKVKLAFWFIRSKLICRKIRLIRFPIELRGKKYVDFGKNLTTGVNCRLEAFSSGDKVLFFGNDVQINDNVHIAAMKHIKIGNNVLMASKIYISDCVHGSYKGDDNDTSPNTPPVLRAYSVNEVIIEDNVWIGEAVSILPGTRIGKGAIIGAHSVVTKDIPPYSIAVGIPARPIKKFDFEMNKWRPC